MQPDVYRDHLLAEKAIYEDRTEIHALPRAFHYWSNRFIRPKLEALGFSTPDKMFAIGLERLCAKSARNQTFLSVGSGNCDIEIETAAHLRQRGFEQFTIECLELNDAMLARGALAAENAHLAQRLIFTSADANEWIPQRSYDAVICNQSLHHIVRLEHVFDNIRQALSPGGLLIVSDMIGRNGHQRWPEALARVQEFWRQLPPSYRVNDVLNRYEEWYGDWDCSVAGFEGIRSQDILPLLLDRFHFRFFFGFGNIIDPFVDRQFGHHFDRLTEWDRDFLDRVHQCDMEELSSGRCKPTHMLAVVGLDPEVECTCGDNLSPAASARIPAPVSASESLPANDAYEVRSWPSDLAAEAVFAAQRVARLERRAEELVHWGMNQNREFEERTAWALRLDTENAGYAARTRELLQRVEELESLVDERTRWAQRLDWELAEKAAALSSASQNVTALDREVNVRTAWAQDLECQLAERTAWALRLDEERRGGEAALIALREELRGYVRNPVLFGAHWLRSLRAFLRSRLRGAAAGKSP